jgi:diguanylate cyclase (GGDEF)-like protein
MKTSSSSNVLGWPQPGPMVRSGSADATPVSDAPAPRHKPSGVHRIERDSDSGVETGAGHNADNHTHHTQADAEANAAEAAQATMREAESRMATPMTESLTTESLTTESQRPPRMHSGTQSAGSELPESARGARAYEPERDSEREAVQNAPRPRPERDTFRSSFASLPELLSSAAFSPRSRVFAPTNVAVITAVTALSARFLGQNEWLCALLWLTPLAFLFWRRQRGKWSLYAAMLWLGLAWLDLVHPVVAEVHGQVRGVLSLCVLGAIVLRLREVYRSMQELSRRDPLTGLLNRRGFEELGGVELQRAARYGRSIAFALLDVDRFKQINDHYGHATGDRVLQLVAAELRELRKSDVSVRLGGDEFGLLMPETDVAGAELLVARLRQRVRERMQEQGWPVTISVGIAATTHASRAGRPTRAWRLDAMIAEADSRMYDAKSGAYRHAQ